MGKGWARRPGFSGFTMIELMVAIGILMCVISIVTPQWWLSLERARASGCLSNLKNLSTAVIIYGNENEGVYPGAIEQVRPSYYSGIPICPASRTNTYSPGYDVNYATATFTIACSGWNHRPLGYLVNQPYYEHGKGFMPY